MNWTKETERRDISILTYLKEKFLNKFKRYPISTIPPLTEHYVTLRGNLSKAKQYWHLTVEEAGKDFVIVRIEIEHLDGRKEDLYAKIHKGVDLEFTHSFDVTTVASSKGD